METVRLYVTSLFTVMTPLGVVPGSATESQFSAETAITPAAISTTAGISPHAQRMLETA